MTNAESSASRSGSVQVDRLENELSKRYDEQAIELLTLRRFGDELARKLAKLTDDIWAKDLEIDGLKREVTSDRSEITRLKSENAAHESTLEQAKVRFAQLEATMNSTREAALAQADEHAQILCEKQEAHAIELEVLSDARANLEDQISALSAERDRQDSRIEELNQAFDYMKASLEQKLKDSHRGLQQERDEHVAALNKLEAEKSVQAERITELEAECLRQSQQLSEAGDLLTALENELQLGREEIRKTKEHFAAQAREAKLEHTQQVQACKVLEGQLNAEIVSLRAERSNLEKRFRESSEAVGELRAALEIQKTERKAERRHLEIEADRRVADLKAQLESEFERKLQPILKETAEMRLALDTRDNQTEIERKALQKQQVQFNLRDQQLRHASDTFTKERNEIVRMAKQLANELQLARTSHPLKDYLELIEFEVSQLQMQIQTATPGSPEYIKNKDSLAQVTSQRDYLKSVLASSQRQLEERAHKVLAFIQAPEQNAVSTTGRQSR